MMPVQELQNARILHSSFSKTFEVGLLTFKTVLGSVGQSLFFRSPFLSSIAELEMINNTKRHVIKDIDIISCNNPSLLRMKLELSVQSKRKSYKYLICKCNPSFCKNMLDSVALFYVIMSSNVIED